VSVGDLLAAISSGKLKFVFDEAPRSPIPARAPTSVSCTRFWAIPTSSRPEDLDTRRSGNRSRALLGGVDRSSGSSNWLKEMFLESDYDAMVNYECLMISANQTLVQ
jgi:Ca-activated chloride channel family protein